MDLQQATRNDLVSEANLYLVQELVYSVDDLHEELKEMANRPHHDLGPKEEKRVYAIHKQVESDITDLKSLMERLKDVGMTTEQTTRYDDFERTLDTHFDEIDVLLERLEEAIPHTA